MQRPPAAGEATVRLRAGRALRAWHNWVQLAKFCTVGATGYVVNLAVYTALLHWAGLHYLAAAACSFVVAVTNNYTLNRIWTFRGERGYFAYQGLRFLVVSLVGLFLAPAAMAATTTPTAPVYDSKGRLVQTPYAPSNSARLTKKKASDIFLHDHKVAQWLKHYPRVVTYDASYSP